MSGFTKLASSIVTSSVWCEPHATVRVWFAMMALKDANGVVEGSVPGLANVARVTVDECETALGRFLSPDPYSRDLDRHPEREGRRIEKVQGGWRMLNADFYRDQQFGRDYSMTPDAVKKRNQRRNGTLGGIAGHDGTSADVDRTSYASSSASVGSSEGEVQEGEGAGLRRMVGGPAQDLDEWISPIGFGKWQKAVEGLVRSSHSPRGIMAELDLYLAGDKMNAPQMSPSALGRAVHEYVISTNGQPFSARYFAGFVRKGHSAQQVHTETKRITEEKAGALAREKTDREAASRREVNVACFPKEHPERYARLLAQAECEVSEFGRGRGVMVRARTQELVAAEVSRG